VLVGPSGCGKTTTLKMINRLIEPTSGTITIGGVDARSLPAHELRRGIGYVIQQTGLFPHKTIEANIATVPRLIGWERSRIRTRVEELVDLLGLDRELLGRYPPELSGGQQQRVGVARALAADPPVLLMDEPYSAVDPIVRARLQDELLALQARVGKTIVLVTHDIDEAIKLGDRIALLNIGGVLEQYDTPDHLLAHPAGDFVRAFLGADTGLKRLNLLSVADVQLVEGPLVSIGDPAERVRKVSEAHGTGWAVVVDGRRLVGWVSADQINGAARVSELDASPFRAVVHSDTPLRSALEGILNSQTQVAVVTDDAGDYLGLVDIEAISAGVRP
jgi:osmoprotectant transport system ATP-binding protein